MRFVCDSCRAQYMISDDKIGAKGVKVRCKKCGYVILVRPAGAVASKDEGEQDSSAESTAAEGKSEMNSDLPSSVGTPPEGGLFTDVEEDEIGAVFDQVLNSGSHKIPAGESLGNEAGAHANKSSTPDTLRKLVEAEAKEGEASPPANDWYVAIDERQVGPLSVEKVKDHWDRGEVGPDSLCWRPGFSDWIPISEITELAPVLAPRPAKPVIVAPATVAASSSSTPAPVESAFSAGGASKGALSGAPASSESSGWKPSAASVLASLVKEENEALSKPPPKPAPEEKPAVGGGLLDVPPPEPASAPAARGLQGPAMPEQDPRSQQPLPYVPPAPAPGYAQPPVPAYPPPGYPPAPPGYAQPQYPGYPPPAAAAPSGGNKTVMVVAIAAVVVVVSVAVGGFFMMNRSSTPPASNDTVAVAPPTPAPSTPAPAPAKPAEVPPMPPPPAGVAQNPPAANPAVAAGTPAATPPPATASAGTPAPSGAAGGPGPAVAANPPPAASDPASKPPEPSRVEQAVARVDRQESRTTSRRDRNTRDRNEEESAPKPSRQAAATEESDDEFDELFGTGKKQQASSSSKSTPSTYIPPAPGSGSVPEQLGQSDIMAVVLANKPAIVKCVNEQKKRDPDISGKLVMRWTVQTSGKTTGVSCRTDEFRSTYMASCITGLIKSWTFPKHRKQGAPIDFPFTF